MKEEPQSPRRRFSMAAISVSLAELYKQDILLGEDDPMTVKTSTAGPLTELIDCEHDTYQFEDFRPKI